MAYIQSENIQIYPSAYRDGSIDPFAQLNTEFNLTHTKMLSSIDENNNYSYEDGNYLVIYLHGYYFKILKSEITNFTHDTNNVLYAVIRINKITVETSTLIETLVNYETITSTILDDGTVFKGLVLVDTITSDMTTTNGYYYIKVAEYSDSAWNIVTQSLKLSTTEIRDTSNNSINNTFTGLNINSTNLTSTNINSTEKITINNLDGNYSDNDSIIYLGKSSAVPQTLTFVPKTSSGSDPAEINLGTSDDRINDIYCHNINVIDIYARDISCWNSITPYNIDGRQYENNISTIYLGMEDLNFHQTLKIIPKNAAISLGWKTAKIELGENNNSLSKIYSDNIYSTNTSSTTFTATSDIRLKENIEDYKCEKSILDLPIKQFDFKTSKHHSIGCIAQDLKEICPEIVHENEDGYLTIEENKLIYLLIQEVKELKEEIKRLK